MDFFEVLKTRRSIRKYTEQPVSEAELHSLLEAAMLAPSAHNRQPWHFVLLRDAALRAELAARHPYAAMLEHAPLGIVVCADLSLEKTPGFWVQDCAAAMQNMLLAARACGIGSVWCGLHPVKALTDMVAELLHLPEHIMPLGLMVLGHTEQEFRTAERFRPERIHENHW